MHKLKLSKIILMTLILMISVDGYSSSVEFPEEELATDTVLPKFDNQTMVKNRYVTTKGRFEIQAGAGFNLTEALYNNQSFHLGLGYNFTETHAVQIVGMFVQPGLSQNGISLRDGDGLVGDSLNAELAPSIENMVLLDYQFTAWYGKVSVTKNSIWHLSLYGLLGASYVGYRDSSSVALNVGFGQKFYLTKNLALKTDLRFHFYQGPNPADATQTLDTEDNIEVSSSDLETILYIPTILQVGLMFIF